MPKALYIQKRKPDFLTQHWGWIAFFALVFVFIFAIVSYAQEEEDTLPVENLSSEAPALSSLELTELLASSPDGLHANILREEFKATFRTVDRYLDETNTLEVEGGGSRIFASDILISVEACIEEHQAVPGNDAAFVVMSDRQGQVLFSGWMMALYPGASLFEHPRYNIYLKGCAKL